MVDHLEYMNNSEIIDIYPLSNNKELIAYENLYNPESEYKNNTLVSISIAAAVTAGARVYMSYFKNMEGYTVYYSDTDSIDLDKPIDPKYIGSELGQMKLEHVFDEAVYLTPKMYGSRITKPNHKWDKRLSKGDITIKDEIYILAITENKRKLIFDSNNNFIDTKPLII